MIWAIMLFAMGIGGNGDSSANAPNVKDTVATTISSAMIQAQHSNLKVDASNPPVKIDPQPTTPAIKGIYVTAYSAGGSRMTQLLELLDKTELNSMVIDIKDDAGYITYPTTNPELLKLGKPQKFIKDIFGLMDRLKKHNVYPIARIVVFKDTVLANKNPEMSFRNADGSVGKTAREMGSSIPIIKKYGIIISPLPRKQQNSVLRKSNLTMYVSLRALKKEQTN